MRDTFPSRLDRAQNERRTAETFFDARVPEILEEIREELRVGERGGLRAHWFVPEITRVAGELVTLATAVEMCRHREDEELDRAEEMEEAIGGTA